MRKLNERERAFVDAFLGPARGNASRAALVAGYGSGNIKTAGQLGWRLLKKVEIQRAIHKRVSRQEASTIATNDEIDRNLTRLIRHGEEKVSLGASRELSKVRGRHSIKVSVEGALTLEQAIMESRK